LFIVVVVVVHVLFFNKKKLSQFIVKAVANAALDMAQLNEKTLYVWRQLPDRPLLLEVTYERLVALSRRADSCFLKQGIYPAVRFVCYRFH
jgi:hypothetical protein